MKRGYGLFFFIFAYFFTTSILGALVGDLINNTYNIRPMGTIISLLGFYILSWVGLYVYIKYLNK